VSGAGARRYCASPAPCDRIHAPLTGGVPLFVGPTRGAGGPVRDFEVRYDDGRPTLRVLARRWRVVGAWAPV
jgi:hypothetical protein